MIVTRTSKVQGATQFGSEGITISVSHDELGISDPKTPKEIALAAMSMTKCLDVVIDLEMYNSGLLSAEEYKERRRSHRWGRDKEESE